MDKTSVMAVQLCSLAPRITSGMARLRSSAQTVNGATLNQTVTVRDVHCFCVVPLTFELGIVVFFAGFFGSLN